MQLSFLHLDAALRGQRDFLEACRQQGFGELALETLGEKIRLWGLHDDLDQLKERLRAYHSTFSGEPLLTYIGSGDFHHVTALLIELLLETHDGPLTVLQFDNHPDWVQFEKGIHCGSWVNRAAACPQVEKIITVGVSSQDLRLPDMKGANLSLLSRHKLELFPQSRSHSFVWGEYGESFCHWQRGRHLLWQRINDYNEDEFADMLLSRISTEAVYITIDKDVLDPADAATNWDQGSMRLPYLRRLIEAVGAKHRIVGADVTGDYSPSRYSGSRRTQWMKRLESWMDQPRARIDMMAAAAQNASANQCLLDTFREAMA